MDSGVEPATKKGSAATLAAAAQSFLSHIKAKREPSTHREYSGHLDAYLIPKFGKLPLDKIATGELRQMHQKLSGRPTLANRIMDTLSSLYGWQQGNEPNKPLFNPAGRKLVERYKEDPREFRLKPDQLIRLAKVLKDFERKGNWSPFALAAIWLYLATGQRRDSIRTMLWTNVDWDYNTVTMHLKRRGMVAVPFNDAAMSILRQLRDRYPADGNQYVIRGSKPGQPYKNIQDCWRAVREAAGLKGVRIHDLRHHVGSMIGDTHHVATVAKVLGNTKAAAMRYIHADDDAAQMASKGVGDIVASLLK
jgi:integrase